MQQQQIMNRKKASSSSLAHVLEDAGYVDSVEIVVPVDGLWVEVEHLVLRGVHRHAQPQPLQVYICHRSFITAINDVRDE